LEEIKCAQEYDKEYAVPSKVQSKKEESKKAGAVTALGGDTTATSSSSLSSGSSLGSLDGGDSDPFDFVAPARKDT
jgi:hypothetical protein